MRTKKQKPTTQWLRHRAIGQNQPNQKPNSAESIKRLQLENVLEGHLGCVNCLEWNRSGDLLASGSDDRNVILWRPFRRSQQRIAVIPTGHQGTIFSVKFMPESFDNLIATCASDFGVKVTNSITNKTILNCDLCHTNRVKRLEVHPNEPNLVWSAAEDGLIMQYDMREEHSCKPNTKPKSLLIDLKTYSNSSAKAAKCLAINPMRDEMLAVGSDDILIRLFDRRFMGQSSSGSCTAYFSPGHLLKQPNHLKSQANSRSLGTTYLVFSPDGHELLANFHAEQVYLFNVQEPWERYKSFEITAKPLILDQPIPIIPNKLNKNRPTYSQWRELRKIPSKEIMDLPKGYRNFYDELNKKLSSKVPLPLEDYVKLNELLAETRNCPELFHLRAIALIQRGWRGDYYQAIRDCCCALALKPLDHQAVENLAYASYFVNDKEAVYGLLEIMRILQSEFGALHETIAALSSCMVRDSSLESAPSWFYSYPAYDGQLTPPESVDRMRDLGDEEQQEDEDRVMSIGGSSPRERLISMMMDINSPLRCHKQPLDWPSTNQCNVDAFDYSRRYCGHCNLNTDIKEVNFFGNGGDFVVGGSDDGAFYIWDKETTNIVKAVHGDLQILNCLQSHPSIYMLATSGIESTVKLWSPSGNTNYDVKSLDTRCAQNQVFINSDPLEAMMMMLYRDRYI